MRRTAPKPFRPRGLFSDYSCRGYTVGRSRGPVRGSDQLPSGPGQSRRVASSPARWARSRGSPGDVSWRGWSGGRRLDGSGQTPTAEETPFPAAVQQVEQRGRAVLLPQARLGLALMPGERFRGRAGKVGRIARAEMFQGSALGGRLDLDQAVRRIDALAGEHLGEQDQVLERPRVRARQIPDPRRPIPTSGG